ncbi:protein angel homolog 2 isoform X2 [Patella vulgata]|nr:protein angel homolog 2 isoform X2 [Patella vulgata]
MEKTRPRKFSSKRKSDEHIMKSDPKIKCTSVETGGSAKVTKVGASEVQNPRPATMTDYQQSSQASCDQRNRYSLTSAPTLTNQSVPVSEISKASVLQFQPRALYSTRTQIHVKSSKTSVDASQHTTTSNNNMVENVAQGNWTSLRPKEKQKYNRDDKPLWSRYDDPKQYRKHKKDYKPSNKGKRDPIGFSSLPRKWEYTEAGLRFERESSGRFKSGLPFTVMSYNVLSQKLLEWHLQLYANCSPESLDWDMRSERILEELKYFKPDIICLQEVQFDHYESFFRHHLRKMGYGSEYLKRSGDKPDGCATFFNLEKFSLLQSTPVEYYRGGLLDRDNVALILELAPNSKFYHGSANKLCIANTHLLYNPRRGDIKLGQLMVLLAELDICLHKPSKNDAHFDHDPKLRYAPVVLCGDFNSGPQSDLYKFLSTGYVHYEGLLTRQFSGQREGFYGRNVQLHRHFFDKSYGITDQCQYVEHLIKRHINIQQTKRLENSEMPPSASVETETQSDIQDRERLNFENVGFKEDAPVSDVSKTVLKSDASENWDAEIEQNQTLISNDSSTSDYNSLSSSTQPHFSHASGKLWHKFNLLSAYKHRIQRCGFREPEVTTLHDSEGCTVDYIFYSGSRCNRPEGKPASQEGKLKLLARYGLMSGREINNIGGLPNHIQGSDHVSLLTKFLLK